MSGRATVAVAGVLAAVVLLAACGGGGDTSGGDGNSGDGSNGAKAAQDGEPAVVADTTLTKKQYSNKGDKICEAIPTKYNELLQKLPKKQQENPVQSVPKAAIPPLWDAVAEFAELGAPSGEEKKAQEVIVALEKAARGLEKEPKGELAGPNSSFAEFNRLTGAYEMESCATL